MDYFGNQRDPSGRLFSQSYQRTPGKYFGDFTLTSQQLVMNNSITLKGQEDYFAICRLMSHQTGTFRACLHIANGDRFSWGPINGSTDRTWNDCMFGTASRPAVLPVPIIIPGSSTIYLDLEDTSVAGNTVHAVFEGFCLYLQPGQ